MHTTKHYTFKQCGRATELACLSLAISSTSNCCITSGFIHPMEGHRDDDLHSSAGDLREVLGVEDEEKSRPLALSRVHHDAQEHA